LPPFLFFFLPGPRQVRKKFNFCDETISSPRQGLEEPGMFGIVFQDGPYLPNCVIQALLKVHEGLRTPNLLSKFLARHNFADPAHQNTQDFGRLGLKLYGIAIAAELSVAAIEFKSTEAYTSRGPRLRIQAISTRESDRWGSR
jgi:hypothetical protein